MGETMFNSPSWKTNWRNLDPRLGFGAKRCSSSLRPATPSDSVAHGHGGPKNCGTKCGGCAGFMSSCPKLTSSPRSLKFLGLGPGLAACNSTKHGSRRRGCRLETCFWDRFLRGFKICWFKLPVKTGCLSIITDSVAWGTWQPL